MAPDASSPSYGRLDLVGVIDGSVWSIEPDGEASSRVERRDAPHLYATRGIGYSISTREPRDRLDENRNRVNQRWVMIYPAGTRRCS